MEHLEIRESAGLDGAFTQKRCMHQSIIPEGISLKEESEE